MFARYRTSILLCGLLVIATGCNEKIKTTTQMQHENMDEAKELHGAHLDQMADNGMIHNMSVVDFHFVPHTAELSGTGVTRLDRLAPYLETYGGTVRYETYLGDEALVGKRMLHVREYLALAGCDMQRVKVERLISGGRKMAATEAIDIKEKGTAMPDEQGGDAGVMPTGMTQTQP